MIDRPATFAELAQRYPHGTVEIGGHCWLITLADRGSVL